MQNPRIEKPSEKYKDSFVEGIQELFSDGWHTDRSESEHKDKINNFEKYIQSLEDGEKGIGLPEGYVPHTQFWIIDNDEFIGEIDFRHKLNDNLEKIGGHIGYAIRPKYRRQGYASFATEEVLKYAHDFGLDKVLITCDDNNIGSIKVIEKNGGILQDKIDNGKEVLTRRYWIKP